MASPPPSYVPPPWIAWFRRNLWFVAGALGIIAITALRPRLRHVPEPPPVLFALPQYALVDQNDRPFTEETLSGSVWVASFVFTNCPSSCPAVSRAMASLHERLAQNDVPVQLVSFTVDPEHDTPAVLREYGNSVGADGDSWRFVTGDPAAIRRLVRDGFHLGIGEREPTKDGPLYDIAHSTQLALIDQDGNVRGFYGLEQEQGLDEIYHRAQHVIAQRAEGTAR